MKGSWGGESSKASEGEVAVKAFRDGCTWNSNVGVRREMAFQVGRKRGAKYSRRNKQLKKIFFN